ncbi:TPR repeat-containing adenylate/guanylate cyclase [Salinisphaera sp. PC39]|uniref:hypothetical protein n=1 Tax=Salinisphaera sp. PC39 TaxID=1304156 RepID=UPI00333F4EAC
MVDVASHHGGHVHDFEGDGAMLYFAGPGEALPAAFALRAALAEYRRERPSLPQARFSVDAKPLVIGRIGTRFRRGPSFIGPSINRTARILPTALSSRKVYRSTRGAAIRTCMPNLSN